MVSEPLILKIRNVDVIKLFTLCHREINHNNYKTSSIVQNIVKDGQKLFWMVTYIFVFPESLNHSFSTTKSSLSSSEVSLLTCSATIHYPPLTSISIVKNEIILKTAVNTTLTVSTNRLGVSPFGSYQCRVNASGVPFTQKLMIKERGMCIICHCL